MDAGDGGALSVALEGSGEMWSDAELRDRAAVAVLARIVPGYGENYEKAALDAYNAADALVQERRRSGYVKGAKAKVSEGAPDK